MLNEQQAALLIFLTRNSDRVVDCNAVLINRLCCRGWLALVAARLPNAVRYIT